MAKLSQYHLLSLLVFLDRRPTKEFGDLKSLRKITKATSELQEVLGEYYKKFIHLETATFMALLPFRDEVKILNQEFSEIVNVDGTVKDLKTDELKEKKKQYDRKLVKINEKANKDGDLKKANDEFIAFQKEENDKELEFEFKDKELETSVKAELESHGLQYEWQQKNILIALCDFFGL